jgi:hypothetical protein
MEERKQGGREGGSEGGREGAYLGGRGKGGRQRDDPRG